MSSDPKSLREFHVHPVREFTSDADGSTYCEVVPDPRDADRWSVYGRDPEGLAWWVCDCSNDETAGLIAAALNACQKRT